MTVEELNALLQQVDSMGKSSLKENLKAVIQQLIETLNANHEREKADEAEKQNVQKLKNALDKVTKKNVEMSAAVQALAGQVVLKNGALFAQSTETMKKLTKGLLEYTGRFIARNCGDDSGRNPADVVADLQSRTPQDPIDEDAPADPDPAVPENPTPEGKEDNSASSTGKADNSGENGNGANGNDKPPVTVDEMAGKEKKKHGGRRKGMNEWMDSLPHKYSFVLNEDLYNRLFGVGRWHLDNWVPQYRLIVQPAVFMVDVTYYPVIAPNDLSKEKFYDKAPEGEGVRIRKGSYVSPSLLSQVIDTKFEQHNALYSVEQYYKARNVLVDRDWMSRWIITASETYFRPVVKHLSDLLRSMHCNQCDETPWEVIRDNRNPGSKSYFWVHTGSELDTGHKAIVFCFELTRATEHLREFYGKDFDGVLENDCFCAYFTYAKERKGKVTVATCYMHLRRRFVKAFLVMDQKGLSMEDLEKTIEGKVIRLLGKIYREENKLKKRSDDERLAGRQEKVKPLVDELFALLHQVDLKDLSLSSYLVDAVKYALKHEESFRVFLTDPKVPIDNGECERSLRGVTRLRSSSLFSYSIPGADANANCHTLVETAKANGAIANYYLQYLLEEMPKYVDEDGNLRCPPTIPESASEEEKERLEKESWSFLEKLMPWSEEYRAYEKEQLKHQYDFLSAPVKVMMPHVQKGKVYYTEITQEEAARYDRKRWKRMHQEEAKAAS